MVVGCAELADHIPGSGTPVLLVDSEPGGAAAGGEPAAAVPEDDAALVVYPSTSAGRPTGLVLSRRAAAGLVHGGDPWRDVRRLATEAESPGVLRPARNATVHVLDERLRPVPFGVLGELFVGGDLTAHGYHRRPGPTAARFVPSPFAPGRRLYRTGDLARLAANGSVSLAGTADQRITIRGHRVQPAEIETRLGTHPSVAEVAVLAMDGELVAYLVIRPDGTVPSIPDLRDRLRDLPGCPLPAVVTLDAIPRDRHGRPDRATLPSPSGEPPARPAVEPRDAVEKMVLDCFRRVLGNPGLGVTDDFFDHGGGSISATRLLAEIEQLSGHPLVLRELFRETTAAAVAAMLRAERPAPVDEAPCAPVHPRAWCPGHVLLTVPGRPLGIALLRRLLAEPDTEVSVLVDAPDDHLAMERLRNTAGTLGVDLGWYDRLHAVAGDPAADRFGLPSARYDALARDVAAVYHGLRDDTEPAVRRGTRQVIRFAATGAGKALHYLRVPDPSTRDVPESIADDAGEDLVYQAACRGVPVTILRVWPVDLLGQCLTAVLRFGRLPDLPTAPLHLLAAEQLADVIVHIGRTPVADGEVVNLADPRPPLLADLVAGLGELGRPVELVPPGVLSPEELILLRPLLDGAPRIEARRAAAILGRPLTFAGLTAQYLRGAVNRLEKNQADQGAT